MEAFLEYPLPQTGLDYSLAPADSLAYRNYMEAVCDPDEQAAAKFIYDHTRYVGWWEFVGAFWKSIDKLVETIGNRRWVAFVTDKDAGATPEKSYFWTFRIAFHYLRQYHPEMVQPNRLLRIVTARNLGADDPNPETVVYVKIDDMSYSGSQMVDFTNEFKAQNPQLKPVQGKKTMLALVVPFMSFTAGERLAAVADRIQNFEVAFTEFVQEYIFPLSHYVKTLPDKFKTNPTFMAFVGNTARTPIYFAHKMPDDLSTFTQFYVGDIPAKPQIAASCPQRMKRQIVSLVQNCSKAYENISINTKSPVCPWPPYKTKPKLRDYQQFIP